MKNNISQTDALQTVFLLCIPKIDLAKPHFKNQMNVLDIHETVLKNEKHAKTARIRALGSNFCLNLGHFMHTSFFYINRRRGHIFTAVFLKPPAIDP